ncbi:hypothetical protein [Mucilaginibacter sp. L196]|uniref:hypothetical protein n=1 Tax=Mucilaginibacter sp. L196 TaxID=1641870 RepID=UPI00131A96C5|nr:hypothetical protein [Mucilaginibacter sp. L196]
MESAEAKVPRKTWWQSIIIFLLWLLRKLVDGHLLPLQIMGKKLGYIIVDVLEDKLIIRTFLFLTNDGTPEGRKLAQITKLKNWISNIWI